MDIVNIILIVGGLALVVYAMWLKAETMEIDDIEPHHDNRKGSYYSISQKVARDEKERRGF
tara:strand:+ start:264 stop:446 length:183 start_codon:yes stop_codon:yes gene_type:complete